MAKKIGPKRLKRIKTVFGEDVQFDKEGRPIEQGVGAPGHETLPHYMALAKATQIAAKYNPTKENVDEAKRASELLKAKQRDFKPEEDEDEEVEEDF